MKPRQKFEPPPILSRMTSAPGVAAILILLLAAYFAVLHPWLMTWGATREEQQAVLPGDELPPEAYFTRAITINAPAATVWSWVVQIGQDRAGFYSYTWLENLVFGDIHNASAVHPEWQQRAIGEPVPMAGEAGYAVVGEVSRLPIRVMEPERAIADVPGRFVLVPIDDHTTRLLLREPLGTSDRIAPTVWVWDPMHFVMEQRMLRGIKERAEGAPLVAPVIQIAARIGWLLAFAGLITLFGSRRQWLPWLIIPGLAVLPTTLAARDVDAAIAGMLAIGITIAGALVFGRRWWPRFALLAAVVLLVFLLTPDAYAVFGLGFLALIAIFACWAWATGTAVSRATWPVTAGRRGA